MAGFRLWNGVRWSGSRINRHFGDKLGSGRRSAMAGVDAARPGLALPEATACEWQLLDGQAFVAAGSR